MRVIKFEGRNTVGATRRCFWFSQPFTRSASVPPIENETEDESEAASTQNKWVSNWKSNPANDTETKRNEGTYLCISNGDAAE
jgi:hypothetical protein